TSRGAAHANNQGRTPGALGGLNSPSTVVAPPTGAAILTMVSHLPKGDWRIGAPFYFCAALQAAALLLAVSHFRGERLERAAETAASSGRRRPGDTATE